MICYTFTWWGISENGQQNPSRFAWLLAWILNLPIYSGMTGDESSSLSIQKSAPPGSYPLSWFDPRQAADLAARSGTQNFALSGTENIQQKHGCEKGCKIWRGGKDGVDKNNQILMLVSDVLKVQRFSNYILYLKKFLNPIPQRSDIFQNMACHVCSWFVWGVVFEGMDGILQTHDARNFSEGMWRIDADSQDHVFYKFYNNIQSHFLGSHRGVRGHVECNQVVDTVFGCNWPNFSENDSIA